MSDDRFWTEVDRAKFLIQNLCDPDINTGLAQFYLRHLDRMAHERNKMAACRALYAAWAILSSDAFDLLQADFELDEFWLLRLERTNDHLFERVFSQLNRVEFIKVLESLTTIYSDIRTKKPFQLAETQKGFFTKALHMFSEEG